MATTSFPSRQFHDECSRESFEESMFVGPDGERFAYTAIASVLWTSDALPRIELEVSWTDIRDQQTGKAHLVLPTTDPQALVELVSRVVERAVATTFAPRC